MRECGWHALWLRISTEFPSPGQWLTFWLWLCPWDASFPPSCLSMLSLRFWPPGVNKWEIWCQSYYFSFVNNLFFPSRILRFFSLYLEFGNFMMLSSSVCLFSSIYILKSFLSSTTSLLAGVWLLLALHIFFFLSLGCLLSTC